MTSPSRFKDLCLDANDHQALADWWCTAMGYVRRVDDDEGDGWVRPLDWPVPIVDPAGTGPAMWIVPVPEAKSIKNRMHLDVVGDVAALLAVGATLVRGQAESDDENVDWDVLADPEGNEFCCFAPSA